MSANNSKKAWSGPCCGAMLLSLNEDNSSKQGMHEVELTSLTTGKSRRAGIALRRPDKSVIVRASKKLASSRLYLCRKQRRRRSCS